MTTRSPHVARTARATDKGGFTLIELLIVVAMIAVLASIAFPLLLRARVSANEGAAVASLRTIHSAQAAFASTCGGGGYAQTLDDLARPAMGSTVGFVQEPYVKNGVIQSGYVANVMASSGSMKILDALDTCNGAGDTMAGFVAERHPVSVGVTGVRSFAVETQGTLYMRHDGAAIDDSLTGGLVFK